MVSTQIASLRRSVMFIAMLHSVPKLRGSDIRPRVDAAPDGAQTVRPTTNYKDCAPPERGSADLCRSLWMSSCPTFKRRLPAHPNQNRCKSSSITVRWKVSVDQFDHTHLQQKGNKDWDIINSFVDSANLCRHSTSISQFSKSRKNSREP